MRVLVCGGRNYRDRNAVFAELDIIHRSKPITLLIHGAARGADNLAGEWARARKVSILAVAADWGKYGRSAGVRRNQTMLDDGQPELIVAFPGGRGTADMVGRAEQAGVPTRVIE